MKKKYSLKFVLALMLFASAFTCIVLLSAFLWRFVFSSSADPVRDYAALLSIINNEYIGEHDEHEVASAAMKAAVESLEDEWSYYMTADEYTVFIDRAYNRFLGIGVNLVTDEATDYFRVDSVHSNSAAEIAGILAGDIIIAIDGTDVKGFTIPDIRESLLREIGDTIDITVVREGGTTHVLSPEYSYVFVDPVHSEMLIKDVAYISLSNFDIGSAERFILAIEDLLEQGAQAFVFDVRNNGGGRVSEMTDMLDYLLPEGEIFISVDGQGNETIIESDTDSLDLPFVVLINRHSYSAAEYFAATLGEYGYARTVGEQTSGKSRMQTTHTLPGGGAVHISTGQYLTKNRVSLHDIGGLTPDHQISLTTEEYAMLLRGALAPEDDHQLEKALSLLSAPWSVISGQ